MAMVKPVTLLVTGISTSMMMWWCDATHGIVGVALDGYDDGNDDDHVYYGGDNDVGEGGTSMA